MWKKQRQRSNLDDQLWSFFLFKIRRMSKLHRKWLILMTVIFIRGGHAMFQIGNVVFEEKLKLYLVIPKKGTQLDRSEFLENFAAMAYEHHMRGIKDNWNHISYWYDGPVGNIGALLWRDGAYHRAKDGVIGISRLHYAEKDEETLTIAKNAVNVLLKNNNFVFLLAQFNEEPLITVYEEVFPHAEKLYL